MAQPVLVVARPGTVSGFTLGHGVRLSFIRNTVTYETIIAPIIWHSWGWVGVGVFLQRSSFSVATIGVGFKYVFVFIFVFSCKTGHRALLGALWNKC